MRMLTGLSPLCLENIRCFGASSHPRALRGERQRINYRAKLLVAMQSENYFSNKYKRLQYGWMIAGASQSLHGAPRTSLVLRRQSSGWSRCRLYCRSIKLKQLNVLVCKQIPVFSLRINYKYVGITAQLQIAQAITGSVGLHVRFSNCHSVSQTPLRGLESGDRSACAFAGLGLHALSCASSDRFATMTASGCPCLELRAAPFVCRLIASQLALAISFRFGARTPCCGHGPDRRRRQSHRRSGKLEQLNNQVHGRITSFRGRRRCQHTGLTPLTLRNCIINIRTNVPKYKVNSYRKSERRAA